MYIHTRSLHHKVFDIWRSFDRFTKNPDIVQLPTGRLLLIYSDTDSHWSQQNQILTLLASDDGGRTWFKHREIDEADLTVGDERLVTPRLSYLNDGRLVVICDHDDDTHFHEDQSPGNWLYWSEDGGDTWTRQTENGILGFEPDRILDLPDGTLGVATHLMRGATQEFADVLWVSTDSGQTWHERSTIAHNGYHRFCEGAIVLLDDNLDGQARLACVMRENHSGGIPCLVAFSEDCGHSWSEPQLLPFALHRPYVKQLADGRCLVTGRHVNGGLGCYGWVGDLAAEAGSWQVGGPRRKYDADLTAEALVVHNRIDHDCRYSLLPPESNFSEVILEAEVKVEAEANVEVAFLSISRIGMIVTLSPHEIAVQRGGGQIRRPVDLTRYRTVRLHHRRGWFRVEVDGEVLLNRCVFREEAPASDFHGADPLRRTQFGQLGETGRSFWRRLSYRVTNPTLDDVTWSWSAVDGAWPDQYQRERLIQIHGNHPHQQPNPDHGYSSWLELADGRILLVDYTNYGDRPNKSHLVGIYIEPEEIR